MASGSCAPSAGRRKHRPVRHADHEGSSRWLDNRSPEAGVRHRPALALAARAAGRRGRRPARRWPGGLRQQRLLASAASGGGSTPAGHAQEGRQLPPRRHRRRREGHHRRPDDHHQARPGPPDRRAGRRCSPTTRTTSSAPTAWPRRSTQDSAEQWTSALKVGHRVQQRQDAHGRRRHLLDPAHPEPEERALRRCRARLDRSRTAQEDGQANTVRMTLKQPDSDDRRPARPVLQRHRARRLRAQEHPEVGRHRARSSPELHAGPAERAHRNPNYWRTAASRTSTRSR